MGALLGGSGGSRFEWSAGAGLLVFSECSLVGERFATSFFCLFPNGAFGVDADCWTGTAVCGTRGLAGCLPPENGAAGPFVVLLTAGGTLLVATTWFVGAIGGKAFACGKLLVASATLLSFGTHAGLALSILGGGETFSELTAGLA